MRIFCQILLLLFAGLSQSQAEEAKQNGKIVFLLPEEAKKYQSFAYQLEKELEMRKIPQQSVISASLTQKTLPPLTRLYIAFGTKSLLGLKHLKLRAPVLTIFTTESAFKDATSNGQHAPNKISAIFSDPPLERQLSLIKHLLPSTKTIGILQSGSTPLGSRPFDIIRQSGFNTYSRTTTPDYTLFKALLDVVKHSDVLIAHRDPQIFNPSTLKTILLTAYRKDTLIVGVSPAFVRVGSVATTYSTQSDISREIIDILEEQWSQKSTITLQAPHHGKYFSVIINDVVAHSLGLSVPDSDKLVSQIIDDLNESKRPLHE